MKVIINGVLLRPEGLLRDHVLVFDDRIEDIYRADGFSAPKSMEVIDAGGAFVAPGFINEHIHGCGGYDAMDEDDKALPAMRRLLPQTGVTAFLPTTMTYDRHRIEGALDRISQAMAGQEGARVLGAHMEGPFISPVYKGAQAEEQISRADGSWLTGAAEAIRILTLAPEELADQDFLRTCADRQICLSIGHSAATYEEAMKAMQEDGIHHVTHLFNAMTGLHHRQPGIVGAALDCKEVRCELICDNLHVHPMLQRLVYRCKGKSGIVLITDSLRACMLGDGESELGGQKVFVKEGAARLADGTLAGSVLTMDRAVRNFWKNTEAPLHEVIAMVTENPARELGLWEELGSLDTGKLADLVIFDDDIHIRRTIVGGKTVYKEE